MRFVDKHVKHAKTIYITTVALIHMLYFITFLGIITVDVKYIHMLNVFIQTFVVLFLSIRFNPFRKDYAFTSADKTIVFGSAVLLGTNLLTVEFAKWVPPLYANPIVPTVRTVL
jgi:hypothetical protein